MIFLPIPEGKKNFEDLLQADLQQILIQNYESNAGFFRVNSPSPINGGGKGFDSPCLGLSVAVPYYWGPRAAPYLTGWGPMVLLGFSGGTGHFVTRGDR